MANKKRHKERWQEMPGEHPRMSHHVPMSDMMMPDMEPKKPRGKKRKKK